MTRCATARALDVPNAVPETAPLRVITGPLHRVNHRGKIEFSTAAPPPPPAPAAPEPTPAARLLALAHRLQAMIDSGEVRDQADLARMLGLTRARVSQILDLTLLAPGIQEAVLAERTGPGQPRTTERTMRRLAGVTGWGEQRAVWRDACPSVQPGG